MKFLIAVFLAFSNKAFAVCPACTVAVGAGLGLSRYAGVDDIITGIWAGATLLSSSIIIGNFLIKKLYISNVLLRYCILMLSFLSHFVFIVPLYTKQIIIFKEEVIFGVDKFLFGLLSGVIILFLTQITYLKMKAKNNNKPYFPYQKVVMTLANLTIASLIVYFLI
jgi:hypothetical protein